jgi:phosphoribosylformylglycinamidine synthase
MESHNHPSFIEPYQGAATGVGGILRDVFTMGARPIASLNSLRFGRPDHPRTPELLRGVVAGIGGYGNSIGVPTVGGELQFDARYDGNVLVNAFTCGIARADRIFYGRATGVGNAILYLGAKTGRDGIHGATMASDEFSAGGPSRRMTMQVGDPFVGKLLLEACLELFSQDVLEGIQDMGAAGLTSSSVEMAGRADNGVEIDLDLVPRRARAMTPYEILLSESQERMLLVAKPGQESRVLAICAKWDLDAAVIGRVTDTKRWIVRATPDYDPLAEPLSERAPVVVCDLPIGLLTSDSPVYDRPRAPLGHRAPAYDGSDVPIPVDLSGELLALLGSPNVGSRAWVWRQYDHIVRGGTVVRPGSDAAVVRVRCDPGGGEIIDKLLAFAVDCNARMCELDPYVGAAMAVAEACRNLACSGAETVGLTDCLNFGNPERPEVMDQFSRAVDGIAAACSALGVPIVSGNVSLYNETLYNDTDRRSILPTPTIGAVGLVARYEDVLTAPFKRAGDAVVLLGASSCRGIRALCGGEWITRTLGTIRGDAPPIDLVAEAKLQKLLIDLARTALLESAHDVSDGGLAASLAECCAMGAENLGARIELPASSTPLDALGVLFGESPSRVVVSIRASNIGRVLEKARAAGVPAERIGETGADRLVVAVPPLGLIALAVSDIRARRESCLDEIVGN